MPAPAHPDHSAPVRTTAALRAKYRHLVWSNPDGAADDGYIAAALRRANFFELLDFAVVLGLGRLEAVWTELLAGEPPVSPFLAAEVNRILRHLQPAEASAHGLGTGTRKLWELLEREPALTGGVLIGGAALALHLGHRASEGLDLAYVGLEEPGASSEGSPARERKLPRRRLEGLMERLRAESRRVEPHDEPQDRDDFARAGMALADYQQTCLVEGVELRVFTPDSSLHAVLRPGVQGGVRLASLDELFAAKALASAGRSNTRDWFDLHHLLTTGGYTLNDFAAVFRRSADLTRLHLALHRLCSGRPDRNDQGFAAWVEDAPTREQITAFFVAARNRYERALAAGRGGGANRPSSRPPPVGVGSVV